MASILAVRGIEKLSQSQLNALVRAADTLGIDPDWLATVISFETAGSFSPNILNAAGSGAFGLIQFMPSTARGILKTETSEEAVRIGRGMSFEEQLEKMVIPYFRGRTMRNLNDVYLQVFYPAAAGKSDEYIVGSDPSAVYRQNKVFDKEGKGYITRSDITRTINAVAGAALGNRITTTGGSGVGNTGQVVVGLAVSGMLYAIYTRFIKTGVLAEMAKERLRKLV